MKPKCPECEAVGLEHIISEDAKEADDNLNPWFQVVFCNVCGHVYGVFPKHVFIVPEEEDKE
jgi:hypothetical protein